MIFSFQMVLMTPQHNVEQWLEHDVRGPLSERFPIKSPIYCNFEGEMRQYQIRLRWQPPWILVVYLPRKLRLAVNTHENRTFHGMKCQV